MRSTFFKRVALVTLICFASSLKAQAVSAFGNDQLSDAKLMVKIYEMSVESYKTHKDPSQFLWGVKGLVGEDVERAMEIVVAFHKGALPVIEANDAKGTFTVRAAKEKTVTVKIEDIDLGKFRINNEPFVWDKTLSFEENTVRISDLMSNQFSFLPQFNLFGTAYAGDSTPVEYDGPRVVRKPPVPETRNPEQVRSDAKKKCDEQVQSGKKRCGWGFWLGVTLTVIGIALIIYTLTRKRGSGSSSGSQHQEWVDAADGIQTAPMPVFPAPAPILGPPPVVRPGSSAHGQAA